MKVVSYTDPRRLAYLAEPDRAVVFSAPQICATESLARGVQKFYDGSGPDRPRLHALSANLLFGRMLPLWYAGSEQVMQYARTTAVIDQLRQEQPARSRRLRAFRRNQKEVLQGIRTLAEGGLGPDDLAEDSEEEVLFAEVWRRLEDVDSSLRYLRGRLHGELEDPAAFKAALQQAWKESHAAVGAEPPELGAVLLMHGFYFITPLQQRFFDLLGGAGIEVVFLNCWDARRPLVFRTWKQFFPECSGAADGPPPEPAGRRFALAYEAEAAAPRGPLPGLKIRRFADLGAFLDHLDGEVALPEDQRPVIRTPRADELNQILREYYPEHYRERHFLSYPVGQFLLRLHGMWNEDEDVLELTPGALVDCFASGLLQGVREGRRLNGRLLMKDLHLALPFFEGCRTLDEWLARGGALRDAAADAVPAFDEGVEDPENRFHRLLHNPLRLVGYLSLAPEAVEDVVHLAGQLASIARSLFAGPAVSLREHMARLLELVEDADDASLEQEERGLLAEVGRLLRTLEAGDEQLPTRDLAEAVAFYLGAVEQESDDPFIGSMESLDGVPLGRGGRPLHLCLLTQDALPTRRPMAPWPLSENTFSHVQDHPTVHLLRLRAAEASNASLYLFYYALAFVDDVTLSWVGEWQGEPQEESLYLTLLKDSGVREEDAGAELWRSGRAECINPLVVAGGAPAAAGEAPLHAAAEYAVCPRRYYYSWIAAPAPVFRSDFHLGFLYGPLLGWYIDAMDASTEDARAFIDPLFPQWPEVRRTDLAERWGWLRRGSDEFDGVEYNAALRALLLPGIYGKTPARPVFSDPQAGAQAADSLATTADALVQMTANPGGHCRFCPHQSHCSDAQFPKDD